MRILAADDNKTNRFVFSKLVNALDIDLTFATNGLEAVRLFRETDPDLIFMDISMPEMDGKEATRTIRGIETEEGLERTTIVALTAHAMDGDDQCILAAGLDHYLTKPFKKDAILARIAEEAPDICVPVFPEDKLAS
jgi:CheY-like chemotaxis protein